MDELNGGIDKCTKKHIELTVKLKIKLNFLKLLSRLILYVWNEIMRRVKIFVIKVCGL